MCRQSEKNLFEERKTQNQPNEYEFRFIAAFFLMVQFIINLVVAVSPMHLVLQLLLKVKHDHTHHVV